ncbi:DUF1634 domain-containing protein [Pyxidicoccus parkwayensis]|uniref:DUF1634 domain-containing protein n=1 Tax=Pyxidicoccus parkwayensis TaxID=2813578 RepID=A0ABX7P0F7_9BACT|nr:DUF1634 domain-containing protein [Pyxidicoccus parkwaysis]
MSEPESAGAEGPVVSAVLADAHVSHNVVVPTARTEGLAPEVDAEPVTQPGLEAVPETRKRRRDLAVAGDRWIARVLRGGAVLSGGMFVVSLGLEALPSSEDVHVTIDLLRKGAASLLLVTPVARLAVAGALLGLKGEWRYTVIAAGVLGLLAIAVGAGIQA